METKINFNVLESIENIYKHSKNFQLIVAFFDIDNIIEHDEKYKVEEINFKMKNKFHEIEAIVGIKMYSPTNPSRYNCQMGIFVNN